MSNRDLKLTYVFLLNASGERGYDKVLTSLGVAHASFRTVYRHAQAVFRHMDAHYLKWQRKAIEQVKLFYARRNIDPHPETGLLPIMVSMDGSYPKRGHDSICGNFRL